MKPTQENQIPKARLYVDAPLRTGDLVTVSKEQAHYLGNVMRLPMGAKIALFNGQDGEWHGVIATLGKQGAQIELTHQSRPQTNSPDLWLLFAPVKKARLDFIAQKASELGVSRIWPVRTDFCQISRVKDERLAANAIEAAEQTERLDIARIMNFDKLTTVLSDLEDDRLLIWCDEANAGVAKHNITTALAAIDAPKKAAILIGPEGGFSPAERKILTQIDNCLTTSLGPRILRADTAAIAALACYQAICGDWR
ncbi:MAG: 16S rRNA (uracil(1498)-N(3))-methyltransferase [Candidatus Puniceispirillum sp.]|nr:16S rRNA (uracil(1498)-N(3))-methyltransferase [Candidatus Puniceispirillum sp.]